MTGGLAPGLGARGPLAAAGAGGGGRGGRGARLPFHPALLRFPAWASYSKDDVFGLCDVLARAERVLIRAGQPDEAARVAAAFDLLESGLA